MLSEQENEYPSALEIKDKSKSAAKWSLVTEVLVKVISPISQLILARLLVPEAFGMVTTVTMVVNFADMFSDAGFQKYLIQHSFRDKSGLFRAANVAFWSNFLVSIILWMLVAVFNGRVASFVGNPSLGIPLAVASMSLPLTAFSSIQMALLHRDLNFKALMPIRLLGSLLTFGVTVGLAYAGLSYWSLIAGTLLGNLFNAIALTVRSEWKPSFFYSFKILKRMFSFSGWTLLESLTIWLSVWAGTFIVGNMLGSTDLGLYKTPVTFVSGSFAIITNATTPILFSSLSRLQGDRKEYRSFFRKFQYSVGIFLLPLSVGLFVFRAPLVLLLLGGQWTDATLMFGLYSLVRAPAILFSFYYSEMYRSLGKPRISTLVQTMYMIVMVPAMIYAASRGFEAVVYTDALTTVALIAINQSVAHFVIGTSFFKTVKSLKEPLFATLIMAIFAYCTYSLLSGKWYLTAINILGCVIVYFATCFVFPRSRVLLKNMVKHIL